jgi:hypothetical protein
MTDEPTSIRQNPLLRFLSLPQASVPQAPKALAGTGLAQLYTAVGQLKNVSLPNYDAVAHVGFFAGGEYLAHNANTDAWERVDSDMAGLLRAQDLQEWQYDEIGTESQGWHLVKQGRPVETPKAQASARIAELNTVLGQVIDAARTLNDLQQAVPRDEIAVANARNDLNNLLFNQAFITLSEAERDSKAYFEAEKKDHAGKVGGAAAEAEARMNNSLSASRAYLVNVRKFANGKMDFAAVEPSELRATLAKASHHCDGRDLVDKHGERIGVITEVNGMHVDSPADLLEKLGNAKHGKDIHFTVLHDGVAKSFKLTPRGELVAESPKPQILYFARLTIPVNDFEP